MKKYEFYKELDPFVYEEMFNWNVYQLFEHEVKNKNVLDVGGHFGAFSNVCNDYGAKRIIAIEANPYNYLKYIQYTKSISNVKAVNAALTSKTGDLVTINNKGSESKIGTGDINIGTISLKDAVNLFPDNEDIYLKIQIVVL
jgi:FkbM family methyltransferase